MYNRYLFDDREAFDDLYTYVEETEKQPEEVPVPTQAPAPKPEPAPASKIHNPLSGVNFKHLLKKFNFDDFGIVPLLILAFLLFDADDDERLIIIALAFILGL